MPATSMALVLLMLLVSLLVMEPDFGQTMLILMVWGALFFIAGMRMIWVLGLAGAASAGLFGAYLLVPHVAGRIKRFMNPGSGDTFQVDTAMEAFLQRRLVRTWTGRRHRQAQPAGQPYRFRVRGGGGGIRHHPVPRAARSVRLCRDPHACRAPMRRRTCSRGLRPSGLAILFGVQAAINMAVNLQLIPAKGMTLPFISYGGSSIVSLAYGVGMMLALTRQRPRTEVESIERRQCGTQLRVTSRRRRAFRHGEERSDEAITSSCSRPIASAMTAH